MKILALHDGGSGCMYYRVRVPLEALAANGYDVTFFSVNLDPDDGTGSFQEPVKYGHGVRKKTGPAVRSVMDGYDVIIGQRVNTHEGLVGWRGARGPFNRLVYETDDDVFHVETTNFGAYKLFSRNDTQDAVAHAAEVSDLVTVSTEPLRQVMSEFSSNVVTAHNCLPDWAPDLVRRPHDRPCVGWGGGGSHTMDIALLAKPMRAFLRRFPGWDCRLRGADFRLSIAHRRVYFDRWTSVNANPEKYYRGLRMDIGVAPLVGTKFDQSKSFIKVLEYAALGIPSVASRAGPYPEFVRHGENGFLAETQKDWLEYLSLLASDDALRDKLGARAREDTRAWTIGHHWRTWADAYEAMFTRRQLPGKPRSSTYRRINEDNSIYAAQAGGNAVLCALGHRIVRRGSRRFRSGGPRIHLHHYPGFSDPGPGDRGQPARLEPDDGELHAAGRVAAGGRRAHRRERYPHRLNQRQRLAHLDAEEAGVLRQHRLVPV